MLIADISNWVAAGFGSAIAALLGIYFPIAHQLEKRRNSSHGGSYSLNQGFLGRAGGRHRTALAAVWFYGALKIRWWIVGERSVRKKVQKWLTSGSRAKQIAAKDVAGEL